MTTTGTARRGSGTARHHLTGARAWARTRWPRWRATAAVGAITLAAVVAGLLVVDDLGAHGATRAAQATLTATSARLGVVEAELTGAERHLAAARATTDRITRRFDADLSTLSAIEVSLANDEAGIRTQGIDLGQVDRCLSDVEQAVNQLSVGQTGGGLASLRASSSQCSVLGRVG